MNLNKSGESEVSLMLETERRLEMTHQNDYTSSEDLVEKGLEAVPEMMRVLINQAMQVERSKYLQQESTNALKIARDTLMVSSPRP